MSLMKKILAAIPLALLVANSFPGSAGASEFAPPKSYPVGTNPSDVVTADFNGDGKTDIAVLNSGSNNVSILLGNGDGTFEAAKNFDLGNSLTSIAVGDFNGDGKPDLAVFLPGNATNSIAGEVRVLLGNGDGTFQAPVLTTLTVAATIVHVGDFNDDKKADLILSNVDPSTQTITLEIFLGNGDGTFQAAKQIPASGLNGIAFAIADLNNAGNLDLAIAVSGGVQILLGHGNGTFQPGETVAVFDGFNVDAIYTADLNGDGKIDLIVDSTMFRNGPLNSTSEDVGLILGHGDGTFGSQQIFFAGGSGRDEFGFGGSDTVSRPWAGDFNGDGRPDILDFHTIETNPPIPGKGSAALELHLSKGDGTYAPVITMPGLKAPSDLQDLNGDKLSDLITLDSANNVILVSLNISPTSGTDLGLIVATASPEPVGTGMNLKYSADVLNEGPQNATGVTFMDTLPNNVNLVSATTTKGSCTEAKLVVTCEIGALADAEDAQIAIAVTPLQVGNLANTMNVLGNEAESNQANNTATQNSTVVPTYTLTVTKAGNGMGLVSSFVFTSPGAAISCGSTCSSLFPKGTVVHLNPAANADSFFQSWGGACSGNASCAVTMTANMAVIANFVLGATLTVKIAGGGTGTVTAGDGSIGCSDTGGTCSSLYFPGTPVSLVAAPTGGSTFGSWSGACTGLVPSACSITLNANQSVTATFNPPPDFSLSPASGTLMVAAGGQVTDVISIPEQGGFSSAIQLACSVAGPPPLSSCSLSPNSIPAGANSPTSKLTFTAGTHVASFPTSLSRTRNLFASFLLIGILGCMLCRRFDERQRKMLGLCLMLLFVAMVQAACGGGSNTPPPPVSRNYVVTVTAASGAIQHSTSISVTVQ